MILLDIFVTLMLVVSIVYSMRLHHKIKEFNSSKSELAELIKYLDSTIIRAEGNIEILKDLSVNLSSRSETGKILADDLAFLVDRAGSLADKLEGMITLARDMEKNSLLAGNRLRSKSSIESIPKSNVESISVDNTRKATIESLLSRISNVKNYYKKEKV